MNDGELDEILNQWREPSAPASMRKRMHAEFPARPPRKLRWGKSLVAAVILAAAVFFLMVARAFPQRPSPVPWSVDSEFVRYADDGSASIEMYSTSYESDANEILLSRSMPGNPFETVLVRALDITLPAVSRLHMHLLGALAPGMLEKMDRIRRSRPPGLSFITGCDSSGGCLVLDHEGFAKAAAGADGSCIDRPVVGRETVLNHPTEIVRDRWTEHGRMTLWLAPDLGCFALRATYEEQRPDGTFRLVSAKQAVKVTLNP
jgi:hypothetical protein